MEPIVCTRRHMRLISICNGTKYEGSVDAEGTEIPDKQLVSSAEPDRREYHCVNCGQVFDGSETFELAKQHLGGFWSW